MVLGEALGTLTTLRWTVLTGIEALLVVACLVIRAVCVRLALSYKEMVVETLRNFKNMRINILTYAGSIDFVDRHPNPVGNSTAACDSKPDIQHCQRMDYSPHMDFGTVH